MRTNLFIHDVLTTESFSGRYVFIDAYGYRLIPEGIKLVPKVFTV
jgi:hypothetical protein